MFAAQPIWNRIAVAVMSALAVHIAKGIVFDGSERKSLRYLVRFRRNKGTHEVPWKLSKDSELSGVYNYLTE